MHRMAWPGRLASLQILRGLAAWLVVFHHFTQLFFNFECNNWLSCFVAKRGQCWRRRVLRDQRASSWSPPRTRAACAAHLCCQAGGANRSCLLIWTAILLVLVLALPHGLYPYASSSSAAVAESALLVDLFSAAPESGGYGLYPLLTVGWSLNYEMLFYAVFAASLVIRGARHLLLVAVVLRAGVRASGMAIPVVGFLHSKLIWEFLYRCAAGWLFVTRRLR